MGDMHLLFCGVCDLIIHVGGEMAGHIKYNDKVCFGLIIYQG